MKKRILSTILLSGLSAAAWMSGCAVDPHESAQPERTGQVGIELQIAPGIVVSSVEYVITGPLGFSRRGQIDVSNSSTVSAIIGGIPFGGGYQISLLASSADARVSCAGSATFDIDGPALRAVPVHMTCQVQPGTGSILVNGQLNACPRIDGIDATPAEVAVGGTIALSSTTVDVDHAPSPLAFAWTTTSGTLAGAATASPTLTCTQVGVATV